ncbi:hypothetical protein PABY_13590 [Pyrodictium abyssi]|uniref:Uncharacterized protein n=1 Tax=Pyrodictium abyssi TaxID=54256 RepID=A0ABN6ZNG6_9CREN|nr:hypothetical protein PABY_13590 [Pyrodictium abyssi]
MQEPVIAMDGVDRGTVSVRKNVVRIAESGRLGLLVLKECPRGLPPWAVWLPCGLLALLLQGLY